MSRFANSLLAFAARRLTLSTVWLVTLGGSLMAILQAKQLNPGDVWWHLRIGQQIVERGAIPTTDEFTFTRAGEVWVNQPWLMQVSMYLAFDVGGAAALLMFNAVLTTAGYVFLLLATNYRERGPAAPMVLLVSIAVGFAQSAVRTEAFSFFAMGALIYLIECDRRGARRRLWLAVPLLALWVNAHGAFVLGVAMLGVYLLTRLAWVAARALRRRPARGDVAEAKRLIAIGIASLAALALNPLGPIGIVRYAAIFDDAEIVRFTVEFQRLSPLTVDGLIVLVSAVLVLLLVTTRRQFRSVPLDQWLTLALLFAWALWFRRAAAWYGFGLAMPLSTLLAPLLAVSPAPLRPRVNAALVGGVVLLVLLTVPFWRDSLPGPRPSLLRADTPIEATEAVCDTLPRDARLYAYHDFATYLEWACPRLRVFIDNRQQLFPFDLWLDYYRIGLGLDGWDTALDRYAVTHLFLSIRRQPAAIERARTSDCWRSIYRDGVAEAFERACPVSPAAG